MVLAKQQSLECFYGILTKDSGQILWNGKPLKRKDVSFGYLPEERGIYTKTKVRDQLIYFAMLRGLKYDEAYEATENWCKLLGMEKYLDSPAEQLSKGNQQKIQLISAFVNNPKILFLDEPFAGLDPINVQVIKNAIAELIKNGTYIILSSHQMNVVEEYCEDILLIDNGKNILSGNLLEIKKSFGENLVYVQTAQDISALIPEDAQIINKTVNSYELKLSFDPNIFLKTLVNNNISIEHFEIKNPSLHEIFIRKVGNLK